MHAKDVASTWLQGMGLTLKLGNATAVPEAAFQAINQ